ncbi:MAG: hypothetical protein ACHQCF_02020 [Solirubrobacterales bacterium]
MSVCGGVTILLSGIGCGSGGEVTAGATVTVYVSAPLCAGAKDELGRRGGSADAVRVRVACLEDAQRGGRLDLATTGANARRATEDSTAVGLAARPGREAAFARPILTEAGIALITSRSGARAIDKVLADLTSRGDSSPREAVAKAQ